MSFVPCITNQLKTVFGKHRMKMVFSNNNKLKNMLRSSKDKLDELNKAGIYAIECVDCQRKYYDRQTKRNVSKRFSEHMKYIAKNEPRKSAIAAHVLNENHFIVSVANLQLIKNVAAERKLDAYESYFIRNVYNAFNLYNDNIDSKLFTLI